MNRRVDVASLIWGLFFTAAAGCGLWIATGHTLSWAFIRLGIPTLLICLGILGLVLSRINARPTRS